MTDLRERLQIPASRLEDLNGLLLAPDSRVINEMLAVIAKYGTPEEINARAHAARQLPALLERVKAVQPDYLADLHWLAEQRDRGAFITVAEYRQAVRGSGAGARPL